MRITNTTSQVLDDILSERYHQYRKFGEDNILSQGTDPVSLACLLEEHGEVAEVICELQLDNSEISEYELHLYNELIQVAAVATAFAEKIRIRNDPDVNDNAVPVYHDR